MGTRGPAGEGDKRLVTRRNGVLSDLTAAAAHTRTSGASLVDPASLSSSQSRFKVPSLSPAPVRTSSASRAGRATEPPVPWCHEGSSVIVFVVDFYDFRSGDARHRTWRPLLFRLLPRTPPERTRDDLLPCWIVIPAATDGRARAPLHTSALRDPVEMGMSLEISGNNVSNLPQRAAGPKMVVGERLSMCGQFIINGRGASGGERGLRKRHA